jgi:hypothetical protein
MFTGQTMHRLAVPALTVLLIVCGYALVNGRHQSAGLRLTFAPGQPNSPVTILSVTSGTDFLFRVIRAKNVSDKPVGSLTFGVMVHALASTGAPTPPPVYEPFPPVPVSIASGAVANVDVPVLRPAKALQDAAHLGADLEAELGVVKVDFADGTSWQYDPRTKGGFGGFVLNGAPAGAACPGQRQRMALAAFGRFIGIPALAQGYFKCVPTGNCLVCTNNVSTCTNSICGQTGNPPCYNCPQQVCQYQS